MVAAEAWRTNYGRFTASDAFLKRRAITGQVVRGLLFLAAALSVFVTVGIVFVLLQESILFFRQVSLFDFLTETEWTPVFENPRFGNECGWWWPGCLYGGHEAQRDAVGLSAGKIAT